MQSEKQSHATLGFYTMGIVALFLVGFFLLVVFGAKSYRDAAAGQSRNMAVRAELGYLLTAIRANDAADAVSIGEAFHGPLLTVRDGESGYAYRLYLYRGALVEDYAKADAKLDPDAAQVIAGTSTFRVSWENDALRIRTDAGSVLVQLRAKGGAS